MKLNIHLFAYVLYFAYFQDNHCSVRTLKRKHCLMVNEGANTKTKKGIEKITEPPKNRNVERTANVECTLRRSKRKQCVMVNCSTDTTMEKNIGRNNESPKDRNVEQTTDTECTIRRSNRNPRVMANESTQIKKNIQRRKVKYSLKEKIERGAPSNEYMTNEIILATVPGFCAWPARIKHISGETIHVEFFGTGQINPVRSSAVDRFDLSKIKPLLERRGYKKAMRELEFALGIPYSLSLFQ